MSDADGLDDAALWNGFVMQTLPSAAWNHQAHLRMAWLFLRQHGLDEAHLLMRVGIVRLNAAHGLVETPVRGYHETMTRVWLVLVAAAARTTPELLESRSFVAAHATRLSKEAPLVHYSRPRLLGVEARARFVEPDLVPLPVVTPPRSRIELVPHDPAWAAVRTRETQRLREALGDALLEVHHIGSTALPAIRAKPIVDLIPVVSSLAAFDAGQASVAVLGYACHGEYGIEGRRYCVLTDANTGRRIAQLHVFASGSPQITRHVAFRDYLRAHPVEAHAYEAEKLRALAQHQHDVLDYNAAKSDWIRACDARAAAWSSSTASTEIRPPRSR